MTIISIVAATGSDDVRRYSGSTGTFIDVFASEGGLTFGLFARLTFGPDGHLYVSDFNRDEVLRYDGTTGEFIDVFTVVPEPTGSMLLVSGILFPVFRRWK